LEGITFIFMLIPCFLKIKPIKVLFYCNPIELRDSFPEKIVLNNIIWNRDNLRINYSVGLMHIPITTFRLSVGLYYIPFSKNREEKLEEGILLWLDRACKVKF